jgi:Stage II sporulation protein E (SpoIIE)
VCDGQVRPLHQTAPMLGVPFQVRPCDALHALAPSETLVVVTDGVSDSRPSDTMNFFGADRTARVVARSLDRGDNPAQSVFAAACAYAGDRQADDIGILIALIRDGHAGVAGRGTIKESPRPARIAGFPAVGVPGGQPETGLLKRRW